jgi:hypothetical protein
MTIAIDPWYHHAGRRERCGYAPRYDKDPGSGADRI